MKYIRILIILLFFGAITLDFGIGKSISNLPGLSLKNITLYLLIVTILTGNVLERIPILGKNDLNIPVFLFIFYCLASMIITFAFKTVPNYSILRQMIFFKSYMDAFILLIIFFNAIHDINSIKVALLSLLAVYFTINLLTIFGSL